MTLYLTSVAAQSLEKIITKLPRPAKEMKVLFIPTAADTYPADNRPWFDADKKQFTNCGFKLEEFNLFGKNEAEVKAAIHRNDIIFVSGGNTFYLLEHVKKSGFDKVVREISKTDKIYIGSSAGSIIMGPVIRPIQAFDHPKESHLDNYNAIGLVDFVILPHWGKDKYKEKQAAVIKEYGLKYKLKPIKDGAMVVVNIN